MITRFATAVSASDFAIYSFLINWNPFSWFILCATMELPTLQQRIKDANDLEVSKDFA